MAKKEDIFEEEFEPEEGKEPEEEGTEILVLSKEEVQELKDKLAQAEKQAKENLDGWQRERADFSNFKKRIERDEAQAKLNFKADILKKFLVLQDDMELASRNKPESGVDAAWAEGIELIMRKFRSVLENEGLVKIESDNVQFDPNKHQALSFEEADDRESGEIIETLQNGYTMGDRVIRPALVRVAK